MKNRNLILGALSLTLVMGILIPSTLAYRGDMSVQGPNYSPERHDAMVAAFENKDYDAWVALMTTDGRSPRVLEVITAENFDQFAEIHNLMAEGKVEEANALRTELGLGMHDGSGKAKMSKGEGRKGGQGKSRGARDGSCLTTN